MEREKGFEPAGAGYANRATGHANPHKRPEPQRFPTRSFSAPVRGRPHPSPDSVEVAWRRAARRVGEMLGVRRVIPRETVVDPDERNVLFARVEAAQKTAEALVISGGGGEKSWVAKAALTYVAAARPRCRHVPERRRERVRERIRHPLARRVLRLLERTAWTNGNGDRHAALAVIAPMSQSQSFVVMTEAVAVEAAGSYSSWTEERGDRSSSDPREARFGEEVSRRGSRQEGACRTTESTGVTIHILRARAIRPTAARPPSPGTRDIPRSRREKAAMPRTSTRCRLAEA